MMKLMMSRKKKKMMMMRILSDHGRTPGQALDRVYRRKQLPCRDGVRKVKREEQRCCLCHWPLYGGDC